MMLRPPEVYGDSYTFADDNRQVRGHRVYSKNNDAVHTLRCFIVAYGILRFLQALYINPVPMKHPE